MATTTRMVSASYVIFGDKTKNAPAQIDAISDSYALLQTRSNFADASELNDALSEAVGASKAYGVSLAAQNAFIETLANSGKFASKAGSAYLEVVDKMSASNKKMAGMSAAAGGDVIKELGMIKAQTQGLSNVQMTAWAKAHGFESRSVQGLAMLLGQYDKVIAANKTYAGSAAAGMNQQLFGLHSGDAENQIAIAQQNLDNFKEALGTTLLPTINRVMEAAGSLFGTLQRFSEAHSTIAGIAIDFLGVTAAITAVSGVFTMLGVGTTLMYAWSMATKVATAAQWEFNAVMAANPIGIAILAAAAFAAIAYEVYEHWDWVKKSLKSWGTEVLGYLKYPFVALPAEIMKAAGAVEGAAAGIAHRIARLFVGHSPIPEGPLHDLNLAGQVALSLRPGPVIAAARRLASALALTIPLAVVAPMAPAMAMGAAGAMAPGAAGRPISVTVTTSPTINITAAAGDDARELARKMTAALREHDSALAREIAAVLQGELAKKARCDY
jgi:TP901 family phage tail tape measure protein